MGLNTCYDTVLVKTKAHNNEAGRSKSIIWYLTSLSLLICEQAPPVDCERAVCALAIPEGSADWDYYALLLQK